MNPTVRRRLALVAIIVGGIASLATEYGPPGQTSDATDHISLWHDQRSAVRKVRVSLVAGEADASAVTSLYLDVPLLDHKSPITMTVAVVRDGKVVPSAIDPQTGDQAGVYVGPIPTITSCAKGKTCSETFWVTFTRLTDDTRPYIEFDWTATADSEYPGIAYGEGASPPPGASLTVVISD